MKKQIMIGLFFILFVGIASGQIKNQRDASGKKQGYWEAVDRNGKLVYSGYFKDDKPFGEMKRYYPTGEVRVVMRYGNTGEESRADFFWQNGDIAAKGNYIDTKRDSVWVYYSYYTKAISYRVEYVNGLRNGKSQSFYPGGSVVEEIQWINDKKNGVWRQYFDGGQLKLAGNYKDNKLNGMFTAYYPDGKKETEGAYLNNTPDGTWQHYNNDGSVASAVEYRNGKIANFDELEAAEQEFFKKVEEQKGRIKEPTFEEMMREAGR